MKRNEKKNYTRIHTMLQRDLTARARDTIGMWSRLDRTGLD